jgi:hypothetical protein
MSWIGNDPASVLNLIDGFAVDLQPMTIVGQGPDYACWPPL